MSKRIISLLLVIVMALSLVACGASAPAATEAAPPDVAMQYIKADEAKEVPEVSKIRWNYGNSGNVLVFIAQEKGYFAEYGLEIESVPATTNADAMTLLSTGQVDVVSNSGTSNPLQQIASGVDMTIFGGHMVQGCMPVITIPMRWKAQQPIPFPTGWADTTVCLKLNKTA